MYKQSMKEKPGKDLVLTMDSEVQLAMEEIVGKELLEI